MVFLKEIELFFKKGLTNREISGIMYRSLKRPCLNAGVAEQADARDLKSRDTRVSYRFDPGHRHQAGKIQYRGVEQPGSSSGS